METNILESHKAIIEALIRAKKIFRMYPENNPIYTKTLFDTFKRFRNSFQLNREISFQIRQNELFSNAELVYYNPDKENSLAIFFFKDGLREITFKYTLTLKELEEFIRLISLDLDKDNQDDDIITLLWERDFDNISYIVDEISLVDDESYMQKAIAQVKENETEENDLSKAYTDAIASEDVKEFSIIPVNNKDLLAVINDINSVSGNKTRRIIDIIQEMFPLGVEREDYLVNVQLLKKIIDHTVTQGDTDALVYLLDQTNSALIKRATDLEHKKSLREVLDYAGSKKVLLLIGESLEKGFKLNSDHLKEYLKYLDKASITPMVQVMATLNNISARKTFIEILTILGKKDIGKLASWLNDRRWFLVRNIIIILRLIGNREAVGRLVKCLNHPDVRVRREVVKAL